MASTGSKDNNEDEDEEAEYDEEEEESDEEAFQKMDEQCASVTPDSEFLQEEAAKAEKLYREATAIPVYSTKYLARSAQANEAELNRKRRAELEAVLQSRIENKPVQVVGSDDTAVKMVAPDDGFVNWDDASGWDHEPQPSRGLQQTAQQSRAAEDTSTTILSNIQNERMRSNLARRGILNLYPNQRAAIEGLRNGHDIVFNTDSSTGKTLSVITGAIDGLNYRGAAFRQGLSEFNYNNEVRDAIIAAQNK